MERKSEDLARMRKAAIRAVAFQILAMSEHIDLPRPKGADRYETGNLRLLSETLSDLANDIEQGTDDGGPG